MDARELRIGNYVYDDINNIVEIDHQDIGEEVYIFYKPIELTEEILLKCGFKKENLKPSNEHSEYFSIWIEDYKYSFSFAYFRNNWGFYHSYTDASEEEDNNRFDAISFGIKYLHQLQNLYFALTNEELNVQL